MAAVLGLAEMYAVYSLLQIAFKAAAARLLESWLGWRAAPDVYRLAGRAPAAVVKTKQGELKLPNVQGISYGALVCAHTFFKRALNYGPLF